MSSSKDVFRDIHRPGDVVADNYKVLDFLGDGGSGGNCFVAERQSDGKSLAMKVMSFRGLKSWKQLELFEREALVLQNLSHQGIPRYIDYFELDSESDKRFYLIQEIAPGVTLRERLEAEGWRPSEAEVKSIALQLLDVLEYLGSLRPPVVHRDLKPDNIIIDQAGGNRVYLVDFGGVQAAAAGMNSVNSTIIGTFGYMAPEQFGGSAVKATDLYGLGATMLYLLSGKHPNQFPQTRLKIDFSGQVEVSETMGDVLESLLEPAAEDRPSIQEVRSFMRQEGLMKLRTRTSYKNGRVKIERSFASLSVTILPDGPGGSLSMASFAVAWNVFIFIWTRGALISAGPLFAAFSLPFWFAGANLGKQAMQSFHDARCQDELIIRRDEYVYGRELPRSVTGRGGENVRKETRGRRRDLKLLTINELYRANDQAVGAVALRGSEGKFFIGAGLPEDDLKVIYMEIESFLD
ncbi:serine/threonine protein kinase [Chloropicon primus]|nr:serine/threonine protein kinase [Chloropicon primus]